MVGPADTVGLRAAMVGPFQPDRDEQGADFLSRHPTKTRTERVPRLALRKTVSVARKIRPSQPFIYFSVRQPPDRANPERPRRTGRIAA